MLVNLLPNTPDAAFAYIPALKVSMGKGRERGEE